MRTDTYLGIYSQMILKMYFDERSQNGVFIVYHPE